MKRFKNWIVQTETGEIVVSLLFIILILALNIIGIISPILAVNGGWIASLIIFGVEGVILFFIIISYVIDWLKIKWDK